MNASNARERTPTSDAVAAQIRAERAASGLSQGAVFTAAGISKSAYLKLESGRNVADISQLAGICEALGLDLPTFFARAEARIKHKPKQSDAEADAAGLALDRTPGKGRGATRDARPARLSS